MALLKLGAIVTAISGKLGGQVFGIGAQGNYIKNIGSYKKTGSLAQNKIRVRTASLVSTWQTLTKTQRLSWDILKSSYKYTNRLGELKFYNPYQVFMWLNQGRLSIGQSILLTGSARLNIKDPQLNSGQQGFGLMDFSSGVAVPAQHYIVWATPPILQNITDYSSKLRIIGIIRDTDLQVGVDMFNDYSARFGAPTQTSKIGWAWTPVVADTGQRGAFIFNQLLDYDV